MFYENMHPCKCACGCSNMQKLPDKWIPPDPQRMKYIQLRHRCHDCIDGEHMPVPKGTRYENMQIE